MASTNKTINYNLSQYTANDKPTYLVDYNSDMNKIDNQMKVNSDLATLAKTTADDNKSLIDGQALQISALDTNVGNLEDTVEGQTTDISDINTKVGDLTNLNTTDKSSVVSAINEVNTKVGDLTNLNTTDKSDIVSAINEVNTKVDNISDEYSTSEVLTDKVWIDGKPIYRKVYVGNNITMPSQYTVSNKSDIDLDELVSMSLIIKDTDGRILPIYTLSSSDYAYCFYAEDGNLDIRKGSNYPANPVSYKIIVEYTKNSL